MDGLFKLLHVSIHGWLVVLVQPTLAHDLVPRPFDRIGLPFPFHWIAETSCVSLPMLYQ